MVISEDAGGLPPGGMALVPAYNEESSLAATLEQLATSAPGVRVVVIDDGSVDRTGEIARAHGAVVLTMPFNVGIGGALRAGFRYAAHQGAAWAVQVDADGQHDPSQLPTLVAPVLQGADLVIGSRFLDAGATYEAGMVRRRAMSLLTLTLRGLSGRSFTDTSSGFRAFSPRALTYFARNYPAEYMESVEALLMACYAGLRVVEVPVTMRSRSGGVASTRRFRLIYHYLRIYAVLFSSASRHRRPEFGRPDAAHADQAAHPDHTGSDHAGTGR